MAQSRWTPASYWMGLQQRRRRPRVDARVCCCCRGCCTPLRSLPRRPLALPQAQAAAAKKEVSFWKDQLDHAVNEKNSLLERYTSLYRHAYKLEHAVGALGAENNELRFVLDRTLQQERRGGGVGAGCASPASAPGSGASSPVSARQAARQRRGHCWLLMMLMLLLQLHAAVPAACSHHALSARTRPACAGRCVARCPTRARWRRRVWR